MKKCKSKLPGITQMLLTTKSMPPLYHKMPGKQFSFNDSEVVEWLLEQEGIKNFIFSKIRAYGLITYNPSTGTWRGVNYAKDDYD